MDLEHYVIGHHVEEDACGWCAEPLYVGDEAYLDLRGRIFCCRGCARRYRERHDEKRSS